MFEPTRQVLDRIARIHPKFQPVWQGRPVGEQIALALYFLPHRSERPVLGPTRPRLVKWYCPFADQAVFPSGHRYCLNVYVGCGHACRYCYAAAYAPAAPSPKDRFERLLEMDLADLERFGVPPAPIHLSNSTDPFQPLEERFRHTQAALAGLGRHRASFSAVVILTKNPRLAAEERYLRLLEELSARPGQDPAPALTVEVSLAFWREEARAAYDPGAPSVRDRLEGCRRLAAAGIPVVLRIDPLFPRREEDALPGRNCLANWPAPQTLTDLANLVRSAREFGARHVVYSPVRIVRPRYGPAGPAEQALLALCRSAAAPESLPLRGGSWRLPRELVERDVVGPFLALCREYGVTAKFCRQNLLETR